MTTIDSASIRVWFRLLGADLIVVGIGSVPNTELAEQIGLDVGHGIVVDDRSRTSQLNVFAAGDCTSFAGPYNPTGIRLESVQNATDQARSAGSVIAGADRAYDQIPWFWSDQYDQKIQIAGLSLQARDYVTHGGEKAGVSVFHFRDDDCICVETINRPRDHMAARRLLSRKGRVTRNQLQHVNFDLGTLLCSLTEKAVA